MLRTKFKGNGGYIVNVATTMSDQGFWWVCQVKKSSKRLVDGHLGGLIVNAEVDIVRV